MKIVRSAAIAVLAVTLGFLPTTQMANAAQSDCANWKWCMWMGVTNYQGTPSYSAGGDMYLASNQTYKSWWNRKTISLTQKKVSGAFVACTLPNYGTGNGNRSAGWFIFNDSSTC